MSRTRHFIAIHPHRIIYGRVPKVANSAIKTVLAKSVHRDPEQDYKVNSDGYWNRATGGETQMLKPANAWRLREDGYFCFTFVRDPIERVVSCFANKFIRNKVPLPQPMRENGFAKDMTFQAFARRIAECGDDELDVHVRPQAAMLCHEGEVVPNFVGKYEDLDKHWRALRRALDDREDLKLPKRLPVKNATKDETKETVYEALDEVRELLRDRYTEDYRLFYPKGV